MPKKCGFELKGYAWVGPQVMTSNGLELHAVVAEDQRGRFHAGTRYGPGGCAMPELGPEELWRMEAHQNKDAAILAAKADVTAALRQSNGCARTEALLEKATTPKSNLQKPRSPARVRSMDR
jgi:hypothetical protein